MARQGLLILAGGVVTAAMAFALQQVCLLFLVVTVGGRGLYVAAFLFSRTFLGTDAIVVTGAGALPCLLFLVGNVSFLRGRVGVLMAALVALESLALSYRFPGLLGAAVGISPAWQKSRWAWLLLALATILALLPADVSLRVRPQGFHWAQAVAADLVTTPMEFDASGDRVWVGSNLLFNQPRWVWVW